VVHYSGEEVQLTQAARKHRVGKARIVDVMTNPYVITELESTKGGDQRIMFLGDDHTGRALEVVAIRQDDRCLVVHAMDLRKKFRAAYEEGRSDE